jgi:hypothetical protein
LSAREEKETRKGRRPRLQATQTGTQIQN